MKSKVRIEQQQKEIDRQQKLISTTVSNLLRAGMTPEDVASLTGMTVEQIRRVAKF